MNIHKPRQTYKLVLHTYREHYLQYALPSAPNLGLVLLQSGEEFLSLLKCEICLDSTVSYEGLHCQTKESV